MKPAEPSVSREQWWNYLLGGLCAALLFILLSRSVSLWSTTGPVLVSDPHTSLIVLGIGIITVGAIMLFQHIPLTLPVQSFAIFLPILFFSDWLTRGYSLIQGPLIRGEILLGCLVFLFSGIVLHKRILVIAALLTPPLLIWVFLDVAQGRIVFSDDHPVFLARLTLLKENFPNIPFFNPLWNAGVDARDFFATGALNVFFILAPLIYSIDLLTHYNWVIAATLFVVTPLGTFIASRIATQSLTASAIATILSVTQSLYWFRWALKYGTMGFMCSTALLPLTLVLAGIMIEKPSRFSAQAALGLVIVGSLTILWSPAGIVCIPLIAHLLIKLRSVLREKLPRYTAISLILINVPWILLFLSVSRVHTFLDSKDRAGMRPVFTQEISPRGEPAPKPEKSLSAVVTLGLKTLRAHTQAAQPLILFLAIPGLFLMGRTRGLQFGATALWLVFLGTIGPSYRPQLELDRMLVILGVILALPTAQALEKLILADSPKLFQRVLPACAVGFLLAGPFSASSVLLNRSIEKYFFAEPIVKNIAAAIQKYGGEGRTLFAGFTLHELSEGHLAPLVFMTTKPLVASSFAHDKWKYTDVIPAEFRAQGDTGIVRFLNLYNATAVITHDKRWTKYHTERPDEYREVWKEGRFHLFQRVNYTPHYFEQGDGAILAHHTNRVEFSLRTADAVLKFTYFPFLKVEGCKVEPYPVLGSVTLVKLTECPVGEHLILKSTPPWTRYGL